MFAKGDVVFLNYNMHAGPVPISSSFRLTAEFNQRVSALSAPLGEPPERLVFDAVTGKGIGHAEGTFITHAGE